MSQQIIIKDGILQDKLLFPEGVEFVCIVNKQGRIEQSIFENQINMSKDKQEMFAMGVQLQNSMQKDFDDELGTVHYTITEREHSRFVSMPTYAGVLLVKLDKTTDPFNYVNKVRGFLNSKELSKPKIGVY